MWPISDQMRNPVSQSWLGGCAEPLRTGDVLSTSAGPLEVWRIGQPFELMLVPGAPEGLLYAPQALVLPAETVHLITIHPRSQPTGMRDLTFVMNVSVHAGQYHAGGYKTWHILKPVYHVARPAQGSLLGEDGDDLMVPRPKLDWRGIIPGEGDVLMCPTCWALLRGREAESVEKHVNYHPVVWVRPGQLPLIWGSQFE